MSTRFTNGLAMALLLVVAGLGACTPQVVRADKARIVVDADPVEPLLLIISRDFVMIRAESGAQSPHFISQDTVSLTGDYDQTFVLQDAEPRIYVQLANPSSTPEQVRLRVYLDGDLEYDASAQVASPGYLSYVYSTDSAGSNGE